LFFRRLDDALLPLLFIIVLDEEDEVVVVVVAALLLLLLLLDDEDKDSVAKKTRAAGEKIPTTGIWLSLSVFMSLVSPFSPLAAKQREKKLKNMLRVSTPNL